MSRWPKQIEDALIAGRIQPTLATIQDSPMKAYSEIDHFSYFEHRKEVIRKEVAAENPQRLLSMDETSYANYLLDRNRLLPIVLHMDQRSASTSEVMVPAERFPPEFGVEPGESYPKQKLTVRIPFSGSDELLRVRPNPYAMRSVDVNIRNSEIHFDVIDMYEDGRIANQVSDTCKVLADQNASLSVNIQAWNSSLRQIITVMVKERRETCLRQKNSLAAIGIPLTPNSNSPVNRSVPIAPRKISIEKPPGSANQFSPDPTMPDHDYENILTIIGDVGRGLERSPSTHVGHSEEGIRDHLLVTLSTHYENASGETFHQRGKTDILIPHENGTLFIAEIKVWSGSKDASAAIDQLLGYLTWRDSKAALILLVRQQGFKEVVDQIPSLVHGHIQWSSSIREDQQKASFRYRLKIPQDPSRTAQVAIMLFHLHDVDVKRTRRQS